MLYMLWSYALQGYRAMLCNHKSIAFQLIKQ